MDELVEILASYLDKPEPEVAEAAKSEEGRATLKAQLKDKTKDLLNDGIKISDKRLKTKVEKAMQAHGVEIASFDELETGLAALVEKSAETKLAALSDEQILKLHAVVKLKNELTVEKEQAVKKASQEATDQLQGEIRALRDQQTKAAVSAAADKLLADLKPVFDQDPTRAANQKRLLLSQLTEGAFEVDAAGTVRLLDAQGEIRKNDMGNVLDFAKFVRTKTTELYPLQAATERDSPGLLPDAVRTGTPGAYGGPKTDTDYANGLNALNTPAERATYKAAYDTYKQTQSAA